MYKSIWTGGQEWTVCDNTSSSSFLRQATRTWDQGPTAGDIEMSVSGMGGRLGEHPKPRRTKNSAWEESRWFSRGHVSWPFEGTGINSFVLHDGGQHWGRARAGFVDQQPCYAGGIRHPKLADGGGSMARKCFVAWSDCRFRTGCVPTQFVSVYFSEWNGSGRVRSGSYRELAAR